VAQGVLRVRRPLLNSFLPAAGQRSWSVSDGICQGLPVRLVFLEQGMLRCIPFLGFAPTLYRMDAMAVFLKGSTHVQLHRCPKHINAGSTDMPIKWKHGQVHGICAWSGACYLYFSPEQDMALPPATHGDVWGFSLVPFNIARCVGCIPKEDGRMGAVNGYPVLTVQARPCALKMPAGAIHTRL
jgi:hypothetical protein